MPSTVTAVFEEIGNRFLHLDPDTLARLAALHDKLICLEFLDDNASPLRWYVQPSAAGLRLRTESSVAPNVTIAGDARMFLRLLLSGARPVAGELRVSGDIELGQRFQRALGQIDIDWEEHAARIVGDVPAHLLGNAARGLRAWASRAFDTLGLDVAEYLQEESRVLAKRAPVDEFVRAVDKLRADTDRVAQRIERLAGRR